MSFNYYLISMHIMWFLKTNSQYVHQPPPLPVLLLQRCLTVSKYEESLPIRENINNNSIFTKTQCSVNVSLYIGSGCCSQGHGWHIHETIELPHSTIFRPEILLKLSFRCVIFWLAWNHARYVFRCGSVFTLLKSESLLIITNNYVDDWWAFSNIYECTK